MMTLSVQIEIAAQLDTHGGGGNNSGLNNQGLCCRTIAINNAGFPGSSSLTKIPILSRVKTQTVKLRGFCLISSLSQV